MTSPKSSKKTLYPSPYYLFYFNSQQQWFCQHIFSLSLNQSCCKTLGRAGDNYPIYHQLIHLLSIWGHQSLIITLWGLQHEKQAFVIHTIINSTICDFGRSWNLPLWCTFNMANYDAMANISIISFLSNSWLRLKTRSWHFDFFL